MKIFKKLKKWCGSNFPICKGGRGSKIYEINNFAINLGRVTLISYTSSSISIQGDLREIYIPIPEEKDVKEIYGQLLKAWKEVWPN